MVLLWTQHEGGERLEPHELANEVLEHHQRKQDKENLHRHSPRKPPINLKDAATKAKSPTPPSLEVMTVGVAISSEKHVVTLKQVEEIIEMNKRNAITPTPSNCPSPSVPRPTSTIPPAPKPSSGASPLTSRPSPGESPLAPTPSPSASPSAPRPSPVPPHSHESAPNTPAINTILEEVKVKAGSLEQSSSPSRVALDKSGTLAPVPEDQVDDKKSSKKEKKKFYTLPRNWRSKAADFILTKGKTLCECCGKKCSGEVLRVQEKYFHLTCFKCHSCKNSLAQGGFFTREKDYYCTGCYQKNFGQRCATCGQFVEGEVVSALGNTYHQKCFTCARCRQPFPTGERVTFTGKDCLCQRCLQIPVVDSQSPTRSPSTDGPKCAGCKEELVEGQALIALDQQWHIWCFKCAHCSTLLHGEYMGKDGLPYCEKDYQSQFGVKCAYCSRFISGKVLQAGDNHHFHPTCARCTKCGDPFGDGEEMYLQGTAIWHPRCGPGPTENGTVLNGSMANGHNGHMNGDKERDFDGMSSTASETAFSRSRTPSLNGSFRSYSPYNSLNRKYSGQYRTCSPGLILREYKNSQSPVDITRIYTYSYLAAEPAQGYLKRPIDPYDRPPKSPNVQHFHRPPPEARKYSLPKTSSRLGMRALVDQMVATETPRPKSPKMNNEEPIILSHYPGGKKKNESRIERDDFPAPPFPYTDPERRRRWSGSSKAQSIDEADSEVPLEEDENEDVPDDPKLKIQEQELSKISTGIGKVFLQQVKEREKVRAWKATHIDPRNASRTPAADREPGYKLRFYTGVNASPSRIAEHTRPWDEDEFDRGSSYRCSTGRSSTTIPSYNVVSSLRQPPRPGYGFSPRNTFYRQGTGSYSALHGGDYSFTGLGEKTQSTEFSSARSDVSAGSLTEADRSALNAELCASTTYSSGLRGYSSYSPHLRRSLPNMHHMSNEPPKIYPAHLLLITNYRLPNDVDRCHLERHLSDADFEMIFHMSRMDFYRLPEWRRNDMKRRSKLF